MEASHDSFLYRFPEDHPDVVPAINVRCTPHSDFDERDYFGPSPPYELNRDVSLSLSFMPKFHVLPNIRHSEIYSLALLSSVKFGKKVKRTKRSCELKLSLLGHSKLFSNLARYSCVES